MNLFSWLHSKKDPVVIKEDCYNKLPETHKKAFERIRGSHESPVTVNRTHEVVNDGDDFALSAAVGFATDNFALGYLSGGSIAGAMAGEMLADGGREFGGGSGGGAGAFDSWSQPQQDAAPQQDYSPPSDPGPSFDSTPAPDYSPSIDSGSISDSSSISSDLGL